MRFIYHIICIFTYCIIYLLIITLYMYWNGIPVPFGDWNWKGGGFWKGRFWNWYWNCKLWNWNCKLWNWKIWKCRNWNWNGKIGIKPSPAVCVCACVYVNPELVCTKSPLMLKLEPQNFDRMCKTCWLRCLSIWGLFDLDLEGQIWIKKLKFHHQSEYITSRGDT